MPTLSTQAAAALGLGMASLLLHGALFASGVIAPAALELWLTALPGWVVRAARPSGLAALALTALVLSAQYFLVLGVLLRLWAWGSRRAMAVAAPRRGPMQP